MKTRLSINNQEDFENKLKEVQEKFENGSKLSPIEIDFFCSMIRPGSKGDFDICKEYHFKDYYFRSMKHSSMPKSLELTKSQEEELEAMALEWNEKVLMEGGQMSQTKYLVAKETRIEIKKMAVEFSANGFLVKSRLYDERLKNILLLSRFIHFKVEHDFFLGYFPKEISFNTTFGEIVFDDSSLVHILFRHYAAGAKQYRPDQSFFSLEVTISSLHRLCFLVLAHISKRGIPITKPINKAISFRYKGEFYQLYLGSGYIQRKGVGNVLLIKVKSIFPINSEKLMEEIVTKTPHQVSNHLVIYEQ